MNWVLLYRHLLPSTRVWVRDFYKFSLNGPCNKKTPFNECLLAGLNELIELIGLNEGTENN